MGKVIESRSKFPLTTTSRVGQRNLLKRKPRVREMANSDMRWLWAAYQKGMWREKFSGYLSQDGFKEKFRELTSEVAYHWIVEAPGDDGMQPVALVLGQQVMTSKETDSEVIEPFVEWFPWATPRNQIETTAVFLKEIPKRVKIFVFAAEGDATRFWSLFKRYGMVRQGCKVIDYFSRGEHAMLFYTVSK